MPMFIGAQRHKAYVGSKLVKAMIGTGRVTAGGFPIGLLLTLTKAR